MSEFISFIIHLIVRLFFKDLELTQGLRAAKITIFFFFFGFLAAHLLRWGWRSLVKKINEKIREFKKTKRLAAAKVTGGRFVGEVTQFYDKINVGVILMRRGKLKTGDKILIKAKDGEELVQQVASLQIDKKDVPVVKRGAEAGIKLDAPVKTGARVYKLKR